MKAVALILMLCLLITFGGFITGRVGKSEDAAPTIEETQEEGEAADFEFETETYTSGKIVIKYPQVINLSDSEVQNSINEIIKENALKDNDYLVSEEGKITYELDYEVMYSSSGLISIRYTGYSFVDGAAHPNNFLYTINVDVENQKVIKLKDLVNINEGFIEVFKGGTYSSMFHDMTPEYKKTIDENLNEIDTAFWITNLTNADTFGIDNNLAVYTYLTEDSLVISVGIPHYMGDYVEIAINYNDLAEYKTNHALWDYIK